MFLSMDTVTNNNQIPLPNATGVLVMGICSLVFCGLIGLILGIISVTMANKDKVLYKQNPDSYTAASLSNINAGRICSIIGICLSSLAFLVTIAYFIFLGTFLTTVFSNLH